MLIVISFCQIQNMYKKKLQSPPDGDLERAQGRWQWRTMIERNKLEQASKRHTNEGDDGKGASKERNWDIGGYGG